MPEATQAALEAWLTVHPLARGRGLRDEHPRVRPARTLPRRATARAALRSGRAQAGARLRTAAGVPERLAHPHALRTYGATSLVEDGVPVLHGGAPLRALACQCSWPRIAPPGNAVVW